MSRIYASTFAPEFEYVYCPFSLRLRDATRLSPQTVLDWVVQPLAVSAESCLLAERLASAVEAAGIDTDSFV